MNFWKSVGGMLEVELVSAEPEMVLSVINTYGIELRKVRYEKALTCRFWVSRRDYQTLEALCRKRGESIKVLRTRGIYYTFLRLAKRKVLLLGACFFLSLALYLPTRVLFIRVEGNTAVPSNRILSAAEESGIRFGASRRDVRSERVKNALLDAVPQLEWAGVNTRGCTAVISVRERTAAAEEPEHGSVASIVASRDGYILSSTVEQGTGLVLPGQAVKAGQTLISGYTDCGICIQATHAKGEVVAQTVREIAVVAPAECVQKRIAAGMKRRYSLRIGKKRIFFWKDSGISDTGCGRMYKEYDITLPGGFRLPVALCVDVYQRFDTEILEIPKTEASAALERFARQYLTSQMIAGQIQNGVQTLTRSTDVYCLRGSYVCTEMIGKVKIEQNGDTNGETNGENSER